MCAVIVSLSFSMSLAACVLYVIYLYAAASLLVVAARSRNEWLKGSIPYRTRAPYTKKFDLLEFFYRELIRDDFQFI